MDRNSQFLKIYANLPLNQRDEIIVVLDDQPLTWNAARIEIQNDTDKGKEIIGKLIRLGILQ